MRSRLFLLRLVSFFSILLIACSGVFINVSAETYTQQTAVDIRSMLGDDIPFNYTYENIEYTGHFIYHGSETGSWCLGTNILSNDIAASVNAFNQYQVLRYIFTSPFSGNVTLENIDLSINFNFSGGARGGFLLGPLGNADPSNPTTNFNLISNGRSYAGSFDALSCNSQADSSLANYYNIIKTNYNTKSLRSILYDDTEFSINHVYYNNCRTASSFSGLPNGTYSILYIMCPYTYGNFSASVTDTTTTTTGTTSSGDINVTVNVDNTETNSILSHIWDSITGLVSGIAHLFIPDDDYIENWLDDMSDVISDAFTDKVNLDIIKDMLLDLGTYGETTSIQFPALTIGTVVIPARAVQLKPDGFDNLFQTVETVINIICTVMVFNMVIMRIKGIFVGESVVEIEGSD